MIVATERTVAHERIIDGAVMVPYDFFMVFAGYPGGLGDCNGK